MLECEEISEAITKLEEAEDDYDAIEQDLEQLKTKLAFFSSSSSFLPADSAGALHDCQQRITEHEKSINRKFTHFNKVLNHQKSHPNINVGPISPDVLVSIDELIRCHLLETGYASVAGAMQDENPRQLGQDYTLRPYRYESFVEDSLYEITGGAAGRPASDDRSVAEKPIDLGIVSKLESILANYFNASEGEKRVDQAEAAKVALDSYKHFFSSHIPVDIQQLAKQIKSTKTIEYNFLNSMREGAGAALMYLQKEAQKDNRNDELLTELSGRLVTIDPSTLDRTIQEFVLDLRAELLASIRTEDNKEGFPSTDLSIMIDICTDSLQKHFVPLQSARWRRNVELPVEIELPLDRWYHPIVVCPIRKEQVFPDELKVLPCGHMLSEDAVAAIATNDSTLKCPYCYLVTTVDEVQNGMLYTNYS